MTGIQLVFCGSTAAIIEKFHDGLRRLTFGIELLVNGLESNAVRSQEFEERERLVSVTAERMVKVWQNQYSDGTDFDSLKDFAPEWSVGRLGVDLLGEKVYRDRDFSTVVLDGTELGFPKGRVRFIKRCIGDKKRMRTFLNG